MAQLFARMSAPPAPPTACEARLRAAVRLAILGGLWLLPPMLGWLAARGGAGWEVVALLGLGLAAGAQLAAPRAAPGRRARLALGGALGLGTLLVLGAGHAELPGHAAVALPMAALALAAGLCDARALGAALAVLALPALVGAAGPGMLVALAIEAAALRIGQRVLRKATRGGIEVLPPPGRGGAGPAWSAGALPPPAPAVLVQAERGADGALRLAVACRAGGVRVAVR